MSGLDRYVNPQPGSTYAVVTDPFDGWVKIGRSGAGVDPTRRLRIHQTGNARRLRMRALWPVDVERYLHEHYTSFRGHGEWFALPWRLVDDMDRCKNDPKPWRVLFERWPTHRVCAEARLAVERVHLRPELLARAFMSVEEAQRTATRRRLTLPITDEMVERALEALRPHLVRNRLYDEQVADAHEQEVARRVLEAALRGERLDEEASCR